MKKKLIYVLILLCLGNLQAEYNPNQPESAVNLTEIDQYLQKTAIPLIGLDLELQKKIVKAVAAQKSFRNAEELALVINISKLYCEQQLKIFFSDKDFYKNLIELTRNIYNNSELISQHPEMAKLRDGYTVFLLLNRKEKEELFNEKYKELKEIVNTPDFVPIPPGSSQASFVSGMSPDSISDPVYREQYRKVYDKHKKEVAEKCAHNDMHWYLSLVVPELQGASRLWIYSMYMSNENDKKSIVAIYDKFPEYANEKAVFLYVVKNNIPKNKFVRKSEFDKLLGELTAKNADNDAKIVAEGGQN